MKLYNKSLVVLILFIFSLSYSCVSDMDLPVKGICAHRGARFSHPENTISAFREALNLGVQMMEFDVWETKDGKLVVIHDSSVDRTTDGEGLISDLTLEDIKKLDAGFWHDARFKGEKVPTFEEVIAIMPINIWLNIHIKNDPETGKKIAKIIVDTDRIHQSIFACKKDIAIAVKEYDDRLIIGNMDREDSSEKYVSETIKLKREFIQLTERSDILLNVLVDKLKKNNVIINYYGTNSPEKLLKLYDAGINFVLVDDTKLMMKTSVDYGISAVKYIYGE